MQWSRHQAYDWEGIFGGAMRNLQNFRPPEAGPTGYFFAGFEFTNSATGELIEIMYHSPENMGVFIN